MRRSVIRWDGKNLPEAFKLLPPGVYAIEDINESEKLTAQEEKGIRAAMRQIEAGRGLSVADVVARIKGRNKKG